MDFVTITADQRSSFETNGFLVVPDAIDADAVDELIETGDPLMSEFLNAEGEYYRSCRQGIVQRPPFTALISHSRTVPLVVQLLTPQIHLHTVSLIYKKPQDPARAPGNRGWHRDIGIQEDLGHAGLPRVGIKVCYCLTDFHQPGSGMTLLAQSTNRSQRALRISPGERDPAEKVEPLLSAGDALLFENRTFHSAAPNLSGRVSRVVIYGYAYRWMRPDINIDQLDTNAPWVTELNEIDKQLLGVGGYRDLTRPPRPMIEWADRHGVNAIADHSEIEA